jgi:RNA recognition motif-containing protein
MEPSPKRNKTDARQLAPEDAEAIRKITTAFEKHLRLKQQQKKEVEDELRAVKDVVKRDPTLRIFVKRIGLNVPMEAIMDVFERFGKVLDVEENVNPGLNRSVFVTFYHQDSVHRALTHAAPIILNREALKILPWRAYDEPDSSDAEGAGGSQWIPRISSNSRRAVRRIMRRSMCTFPLYKK